MDFNQAKCNEEQCDTVKRSGCKLDHEKGFEY